MAQAVQTTRPVLYSTIVKTEEWITPDRAEDELEKASAANYRPLDLKWAGVIAADITAGRFEFNHKPIEFDRYGINHDGQHRLKAVALSGKPCRFCVVYGSEPTVSEGSVKKRSVTDHLRHAGHEYTTGLGSVARLIVAWNDGVLGNFRAVQASQAELLECVSLHGDDLAWAVKNSCRIKGKKGISRVAIAGTTYIGTHLLTDQKPKQVAELFVEQVATGSVCQSEAPRESCGSGAWGRSSPAGHIRGPQASRQHISWRWSSRRGMPLWRAGNCVS